MKNICFLIGNMGLSGGTERVSSIIANSLVQQGNQVSILSLSEGIQSFFPLDPKIKLHSLFEHKVSMKKHSISACLKIRNFVKQYNIQTLIVVDSITCVFTVPALVGLKVNHICWEHFNFNVDLGIAFRRLGRRMAAKYCDHIVTLTQRDKALWETNLKTINAQIVAIANPTPYENIEHIPTRQNKVVLAMGRLTAQKGFDLLLDAWQQVCQQNEDWQLRIVGSGEDEQQLKDQAETLGITNRVCFIPATKDVQQYFRTSAFFCLSSRFEGFGMVIIEAQSFGLPVISFDCEAGPSDMIENEKNGYLVEPLNTELLAEKLLKSFKLKEDEYQRMVDFSFANSDKYTVENILPAWVDLI